MTTETDTAQALLKKKKKKLNKHSMSSGVINFSKYNASSYNPQCSQKSSGMVFGSSGSVILFLTDALAQEPKPWCGCDSFDHRYSLT